MHDIRFIRDNTDAFVAALSRRPAYKDKAEAIATDLVKRDGVLRGIQTMLQQSQARRNEASKEIGQAKAKKDEAKASELVREVALLKQTIQDGEQKERDYKRELESILAELPNLPVPAPEVPDGADEHDNKEIPERAFAGSRVPAAGMNKPKEHFELGEALGQMDFERAAKVSGARFVYLKKDLARLNRALANFMLDSHTTKFGYEEINPPLLVRDVAMFGTGQLPKFADDLFAAFAGDALGWVQMLNHAEQTSEGIQSIVDSFAPPFRLIPTAEVPLTNYVNDEILPEAELPLRFTAYTPCFRSEAGASGKDTRGMIRMHQFDKVELVSITTPDQSNAEHERMTDAAQSILKALDLRHRTVTLCTGDMGFAARKTYDIEVWLPGQGRFREISSCSNCGDFQARRMNTRVRGADGKVKGPAHTLNGSGLAIGRTLIAILENYQEADGAIAIPDALKPYMGGATKIAKA